MGTMGKFNFAIDRGGTFTDIWARCPDGQMKVLKLLSEDPDNYNDAPREGIRRIIQEVLEHYLSFLQCLSLCCIKNCVTLSVASSKLYEKDESAKFALALKCSVNGSCQ